MEAKLSKLSVSSGHSLSSPLQLRQEYLQGADMTKSRTPVARCLTGPQKTCGKRERLGFQHRHCLVVFQRTVGLRSMMLYAKRRWKLVKCQKKYFSIAFLLPNPCSMSGCSKPFSALMKFNEQNCFMRVYTARRAICKCAKQCNGFTEDNVLDKAEDIQRSHFF